MSAEDFKRILLEAVDADQRHREEQRRRGIAEKRRREQARQHADEVEARRRREEDTRYRAQMQKIRDEEEQAARRSEAAAAAQLQWENDEYAAFMTRYDLLYELHSRLGGGLRVREAMEKNGFTDGVFVHFCFSEEEKNNVGLLSLSHIHTLCAWNLWPYKSDPLMDMVAAMKELNL